MEAITSQSVNGHFIATVEGNGFRFHVYTSISFFAEAAGKLKEKYPLLRYHIYSGDAEIVTEKLDKGLIDLSAIHGRFTRISV